MWNLMYMNYFPLDMRVRVFCHLLMCLHTSLEFHICWEGGQGYGHLPTTSCGLGLGFWLAKLRDPRVHDDKDVCRTCLRHDHGFASNGKWYGRYRLYHLHCMPTSVCASNKKLRRCSLPKTTKVTKEATTRKWGYAVYKLEDLTYRDAKAITLCISRYLSQPYKLNQTY